MSCDFLSGKSIICCTVLPFACFNGHYHMIFFLKSVLNVTGKTLQLWYIWKSNSCSMIEKYWKVTVVL